MRDCIKFLSVLLAITSYGYSVSNDKKINENNNSIQENNVLNNIELNNNVELNNLLNLIYTKNKTSKNYVFILDFHNICVKLINSFNNLANDIKLAEKGHKDISQFGYWYDESNNIFKKLKEITDKNNIQYTEPKNVPELFTYFSQLIQSIYVKFIEDLTEKINKYKYR